MHSSKSTAFVAIILVSTGLLGARLFGLQILGQGQALEVAQGNALRTHRVLPARGAIYDRHGVLIVDNEPSYTITLTPRFFDEEKTSLLATHLGVDDSVVTAKLADARRWTSYRPSMSFTNMSFDRYGRIQEDRFRLPGVDEAIGQKRRYNTGVRASHALGYTGEITQEELNALAEENGYRIGDYLGRTGIERSYEAELRGVPGTALRVVNVYGLEIGSYMQGQGDQPPISGYDVHLALDLGVQALAESLFTNKRGAAVAMDVNTGGLIAFLSAPDFDLELFTGGGDVQRWASVAQHPEKPLYNRASMNLMPPGSTWKPLMALMALETGLIEASGSEGTVYCPGYHPIGQGRIFKCLGVHEEQTAVEAIMNSCNTFFFEVGRRMDLGTFRRYSQMFGFGQNVQTDIREQTPGLIPDSSYFDQAYTEWGVGTTMNLGIGQGDMGVTPLQLARYIGAVANGGWLHEPRLAAFLSNPATGDTINVAPQPVPIPIDPDYFALVRQGLRLVMEEGTGNLAQIPGIASGGKTGTAQAPGGMMDHSVFVMFAPYDDPQIAVAVQCENAGGGSDCAAPIGSLIAERYLKGYLPDTYEVRARMNRALTARSEPLRAE